MNKKYKWIIITLFIVIGMYGCNPNHNSDPGLESGDSTSNVPENVKLNSRQIQILEEQGLPTSYNDLSVSQQKAIASIEEMLTAVEVKYGVEFCYSGYIQASVLEPEKLIAYPASGTASIDSFSVTRSSDNTFSDDYMNIALRAGYSELVLSFIKENLTSENAKVFVEVTKTTLTYIPDTIEELAGNVEGSFVIFIDGSIMSSEQFGSFVSSIRRTFKERQMVGIAQIVLLNTDTINNLTQYNYTDYLNPDCYTERQAFNIAEE